MVRTRSAESTCRATDWWHRVAVPAARWVALASLVAGSGLVVAAEPVAADEAGSGYVEPALGEPVPVTVSGRPEVDLPQTDPTQVWQPPEAAWPEPGVATVEVATATRPAGGLPVAVASVGGLSTLGAARFAAPAGPTSVRVEVLDRAAAEAVGVDGVLVAVDALAGAGQVDLSVDYASFAGAYGGGWASRLRLVELPACARTAPQLAACRTITPVASRNDADAQRVSVTVPVAPAGAGGSVFAVTAEESSDAGDYTATDLAPAGSWTHGGSSGGFTYGYPIRVPPAAGPVPEVSLSYSSQSHDGRTSGTNNQASWMGDGWDYQPGLIQRTYLPCAKDMEGGNQEFKTGDLCWDGDSPSVILSLNGVNASLVRDDSSGQWRVASDPRWRVERLGAPASASGATSERWVVTTTDGTRYFFAGEASLSRSRLTVPVFGNNSGEPCHAGEFADSACRQAYRWMLDTVIDTSGNLSRYFYHRQTGHYAAVLSSSDRRAYHRTARLARIEYGLREGSSGPPTGRVLFTADDRCVDGCWDGGDPAPQHWPDTPWDLTCESEPCVSGPWSPTFFTTQRLVEIRTQVHDGGGFTDVDSWRLEHEFLDYGDESQVVMWLKSVRHIGHVGGTESTPPATFTGSPLPNRVDHNGVPAIWRWRLSAITTETGAIVTVNYSEPDCGAGSLPANPHTNSRLCYPTWWTPPGLSQPEQDWFHKYVVESVVEQETTAAGGAVWTSYDYATAGGGTSVLWAWNDSEFTDDDHRTYSQWRGYSQVTTKVGDPAEGPPLTTHTRYYRGMHGQPLPSGGERSVQLTDSESNQVADHRALAGLVWEEASYLDGAVDSATTYRYWRSRTASRDHAGGTLEAWLAGVRREDTRQRLIGSTWQRTRVQTSYDSRGRPVEVSDQGDTGRSGDEHCTRIAYADSSARWILDAVSRNEVVAVTCDVAPDRPQDVISDRRTYYDGLATPGAAPTRGLPTTTEVLDGWDGGPGYVPERAVAYDDLGRTVAETDALGRTTSTTYTPSGAGPVTAVTITNPAGHVAIEHQEPAWGLPTATVDPNDRRTDLAYDPLGRLTAVWQPGLDQGSDPAHLRFDYDLHNDAPSAVTTQRINAAGGYLTSVRLHDSLLREIQTQQDTPQGGRLVTETAYNTRGEVEYESGPNWDETGSPDGTFVRVDQGADHSRTWFAYDSLGREIRAELWSKNVKLWQTTTAYGGSSEGVLVRTTPPDGRVPTGSVTNARGDIIERRDYQGGAATGPYHATSYTYQQGRLATVTDPAGNTWSYEYDLRGRPVASHDPDSGTTMIVYDPAGQVTAVTDARGETVSRVYDLLGRQIGRWAGAPGSGELVAEWAYDTAPGGVGLPATRLAWVDGQAVVTRVGSYDAAGRPVLTTTTVPPIPGLAPLAGTYLSIQKYNVDGSVATLGLPAVGGLPREAITYTYHDTGQPDRMLGELLATGDTQVYVDSTSYTAHGELAQRTLAASHQNQVYQTYSYADGTRRRQDFRLSRDAIGATNVGHLQYDYDDAGNIRSIADAVEDPPGVPERQCFAYDHLRRLTEAWSQSGVDPCASQPPTQVVGGPAPYWSSYTFDVTGNRTTETRHTPGGDVTSSYAYPPAGGAQPHTVRTVTTGAQVDTYDYDPAGNLVSGTVDGTTLAIDWDAQGKPVEVTTGTGENTRMVYDPDGGRIARIDGTGDAHLFIAGHEVSYTAATGAVTAVRRYQHNGEVVAVRSSTHGLHWITPDHHGTATWAISAASMAVSPRHQDPYGNPRGAQSGWPAGQSGFMQGIEDPTGFVHIGARSYHPATGRFISSDPVTDFADPQQMNGYTYANGNPATFSDPTGLRACTSLSCSSMPRQRSRNPDPAPRSSAQSRTSARRQDSAPRTRNTSRHMDARPARRGGVARADRVLPSPDELRRYSSVLSRAKDAPDASRPGRDTLMAASLPIPDCESRRWGGDPCVPYEPPPPRIPKKAQDEGLLNQLNDHQMEMLKWFYEFGMDLTDYNCYLINNVEHEVRLWVDMVVATVGAGVAIAGFIVSSVVLGALGIGIALGGVAAAGWAIYCYYAGP